MTMLWIAVLAVLGNMAMSAQVFNCNFDAQTLCGMRQGSSDNLDWTLNTGSTASASTGPDNDVSGNGYYIYMEASDIPPGYSAEISTPELPGCGPYKVKFNHHMFGHHIGELKVLEVTPSGTVQVWSKQGSDETKTDNSWHYDEVNISADATRIQFVAVKGGANSGTPQSDIALDQIIVDDSGCSPSPTPPPTPPPITTTTTTTTPAPKTPSTQAPTPEPESTAAPTPEPETTPQPEKIPIATEDFQNGFGEFLQSITATAEFIRYQGSTPSEQSGPRVDHTFMNESGYYIYLEATNYQNNDAAVLKSPELNCTKGCCVSFWYHMFGQHVGTLNVSAQVNDSDDVLFSAEGDMGEMWHNHELSLSESLTRLTFTATKKGNSSEPYGDIALDDIVIYSGLCEEPTTTRGPTTATTATTATTTTVKAAEATETELWGLNETEWMIILIVAACLLFIFLIVICCLSCALHRAKSGGKSRMSDDHENFKNYQKYDYPSRDPPPASNGGASSSTYIYAYENNGYEGPSKDQV